MSEAQKQRVGRAAAEFVETGMVVGLGTGSTAAQFVSALAARKLDIVGVATSEATARQASGLGIRLADLDDAGPIDLLIDGADEVGPELALIKGGGGALLREKLVWTAARRRVVIADAAKRVGRLGAYPLPIEVVAFGHATTARRLAGLLADFGVTAPHLRTKGEGAVVTDGGNVIYDAHCGAIAAPEDLARALKAVVGVVEHGLFIGLADEALIATDDGVETLRA